MIPCTDFIPAYSELFKYLEARGGRCAACGREAVLEFWHYLSDNFLGNLKQLVEKHGIRGCWLYWSHTLNEEAADFTMELDEEAGEFRIIMHHCPSKSRLLECRHLEPYHDYCGHCDVLYRRVLEPLGYECTCDLSRCDEAACALVVRARPHGRDFAPKACKPTEVHPPVAGRGDSARSSGPRAHFRPTAPTCCTSQARSCR